MSKQLTKPPIGLTPKWVIQTKRHNEVCAAISRYYNAGLKIPLEWIVEYNELTEAISNYLKLSDEADSI